MRNLNANLLVALSKPINFSEFHRALLAFHPLFSDLIIEKNISKNDALLLIEIRCKTSLVRIFQVDAPLPKFIVESCLAQNRFAEELKYRMDNHQSHLMLSHLNPEVTMLDQYTMLTAMAWALFTIGAIGIFNENAQSCLPILSMTGYSEMDPIQYIQTLPLPLLFCGMLTFKLEDSETIWARTLGVEEFNQPNIAVRLDTCNIDPFALFSDCLSYSLRKGKTFHAGEIVEYDGYKFTVRIPNQNEYFLMDETAICLVLEAGI